MGYGLSAQGAGHRRAINLGAIALRDDQRGDIYDAEADDCQPLLALLGSCSSALTGWAHSYCLASASYHPLAQTPEGCRASSCSTRRTRQGRGLLRRLQRSLVFQPRLQAPTRRLTERVPGGRKIVLTIGRIVLTIFACQPVGFKVEPRLGIGPGNSPQASRTAGTSWGRRFSLL